MASLTGLFIETPNMVPTAPEKLSTSPESWGEEITNKVRSLFPVTRSLPMGIAFTKRDDENGVAIGNIMIMSPQQDKRAYIPIIIKSFKMYPLDVFLKEDPTQQGKLTAMPLTPDRLAEAMMDNNTWAHLERPDDYFQRIYGQLGALGVGGTSGLPPKFASALSHAVEDLILPKIMKTASPAQIDGFRQGVMNNKNFVVNYEKNAQLAPLKYIMSTQPTESTKIAAPLPIAAVIYAKNRDNSLLDLVSVDTETLTPSIDMVPGASFCNTVSRFSNVKEHLNDLVHHGETIVEHPERPIVEGVTLTVPHMRNSEGIDLDRYGMVCLRTSSGLFTEGVLFPRVIDLDMQPTGFKLFVGPGHSSIASMFIGDKVCKEPSFTITKKPFAGDFGTFVYTNGEGKALALTPMEILSIVDGTLTVRDLTGRKFFIRPFGIGQPWDTPCVDSDLMDKVVPVGDALTFKLLKITRIGDTYILPKEFHFVPMKNLTEMSDLYGMGKYARAVDASPIRVTYTDGGLFSIHGRDTEKLATASGFHPDMLTATQVSFLLASHGCPLSKTAAAVKAARERLSIDVNGLGVQTTKVASVARVNPYKGASELSRNLFKEASFFDDTQIVDHLLSLNFVNDENASIYAAQIPLLEETAHVLAQMVLASRLGMTGIPESASSSAMHKIVEVIEGLKSLKGELHYA